MAAPIKKPPFLLLRAGLVLGGAPGRAQDRSLEMEIAREFLALELAGWRLPDPVESCLTELTLRRLEATTFGNTEMIDQPELVDPPGRDTAHVGLLDDPQQRLL